MSNLLKLFSSPHRYSGARWLFLRLLGVIYLIAFVSLWVQIQGLVGSNGILPAHEYLDAVREQTGAERYRLLPTIFWVNASDSFISWVCESGAFLSLLLVMGILPGPILLVLWSLYLSLVGIGQQFLGFQWDTLLLETGFVAIFFAPWQVWPNFERESPPSRAFLWLLRWLLFRLMFASGLVKLMSGDATWRNLTALTYHYETQPLPTWTSWYAHQLPLWVQQSSVAVMFVIELLVPFLIFAPRRLRLFACGALVGLQVLILATGNYTFFNWLTIVLCLLLLDDTFLRRWLPRQIVAKSDRDEGPEAKQPRARVGFLRFVTGTIAGVIFLLTVMQSASMFVVLPAPAQQVLSWIAPFRTINNYGLFAIMTTERPEIIIEGSQDGQTWLAYEFKWKPGNVERRPSFVAPHQPRLDWQMWFAALGSYHNNRWLINFMVRLLEGSPEVLALLADNPFPDAPPRFIRAVVYDYHFTTFESAQPDGAWWQREIKSLYTPVLSLPEK